MKRLVIIVLYDEYGSIQSYKEYYIRELHKVSSKMIAVVNGTLSTESKLILSKYADHVVIRENIGMDAGAYKNLFQDYLTLEETQKYDEIILSNDTVFGPFVPFESIFDRMKQEEADIWGIHKSKETFCDHLQSNFLVFRKQVFSDVFSFFEDKVFGDNDYAYIIGRFEMMLSYYMESRGWKLSSLLKESRCNPFFSPGSMIRIYGYPFLKKKSLEMAEEDEIVDAIRYLSENTDYPVEYIIDYVKKNGKDLSSIGGKENACTKTQDWIPYYQIKISDILDFANRGDKIWIAGTGTIAKQVFAFLEDSSLLRGFVVSDSEHKSFDTLFSYPVKILDELCSSERIIVALSEKNARMLLPALDRFEEKLFVYEYF